MKNSAFSNCRSFRVNAGVPVLTLVIWALASFQRVPTPYSMSSSEHRPSAQGSRTANADSAALCRIAGKVFDADGQQIRAARIQLYQCAKDGSSLRRFAALSSSGNFECQVFPGDWLVQELPAFGSPQKKYLAWESVTLRAGESKAITLRRIFRRS
jgi:hypothetical protein